MENIPATLSLLKIIIIWENNILPIIPPNIPPIAKGVAILKSTLLPPDILALIKEYKLIDKTVQDDNRLILLTSKTSRESKTGFIIIPPPIPQMAPIVEDKKLTIKKIINIFLIILFSNILSILLLTNQNILV